MTNFVQTLVTSVWKAYCCHMETTQPKPTTTCDICHEQILPGERSHDDGDEIAHTACVGQWFRDSFGRESLR